MIPKDNMKHSEVSLLLRRRPNGTVQPGRDFEQIDFRHDRFESTAGGVRDPLRRLVLTLGALAVVLGNITNGSAQTKGGDTSVLRVGVTPVFPPMIYREGGKIVGAEADFAAALGRELGRPIKFVDVKWEDQFAALSENRTDIIMSSVSITRPRAFHASFAKPYLTIGQMALVRRTDSPKYLLGFPVRPEGVLGVKKGTTGDFLVQENFSRSKRKYFDNGELAARALAKKKIDLFFSDSPTVLWLAGKDESAGLTAVPITLTEENLAWAVRKSDAELLESVNRSLAKMQESGEAAAILRRWIPQLN
jgi:ABC-type amino acid transport substrate-binding protein